jgi:hypothetical protein
MPRKYTASEIQAKLPDFIALDESTYVNTHTPALFIDKEYGPWWTRYNDIQSGYMHKRRGYAKNTQRSKFSAEKAQSMLPEYITLDASTYIDSQKKATFIDKDYGSWQTSLSAILYGYEHPKRGRYKQDQTCLAKFGTTCPLANPEVKRRVKKTIKERYGVENPQQNYDIALQTAKHAQNRSITYHWRTRDQVVCIASYEAKVVRYLNLHRIDYLWQPQIFHLSNGQTYRPDLFLIDEQKWIEIKGYFRDSAKIKWALFTQDYPNSELWNEAKLKSMGIL